jgi:hypothetical protein
MGSMDTRRTAERIPEDVLRRAKASGADELDWYVGRLDPAGYVSQKSAEDDSSTQEARRIVKSWKAGRRADRRDRRRVHLTKIVSLFRKPVPSRRAG